MLAAGLGQVIVGAVLSVTEIVLPQVEELPQSSVAVQVRVTENSCGQLPGGVIVENVGTTLGSHKSEAVAEPKLGEAGHSIVEAGFGQVIVGAVLSVTEIVLLQVEELPQSSVAVQEIGRATSRERVSSSVASGTLEKKIGTQRSQAVP